MSQTHQPSVLSLLDEVHQEINRAVLKFPTWPDDPIHAGNVVAEEAGELSKAILQCTYEPHKSDEAAVREEAIQTAAMAIRFLLSLERYNWACSAQHSQKL